MNFFRRYIVLFISFLACASYAQVTAPYVLSEFKEKDLGTMLDICRRSGINVLIQKTAFSTYGQYEWNEDFAPQGDASVRRMVTEAEKSGVQLGVWVQENAISTDDALFSPEYYKQYRKGGRLELYCDISEDENTIAMRRSDVLKEPASLNLIMIDDELISYSTLEFSGELTLIHRCTRGAYGTKASAHTVDAEVYRIWDSPDHFVEPEGHLRDMVRHSLDEKLQFFPVKLFKEVAAQDWIEENIRVNQVERWEEGRGSLSSLGWFMIRPSDKRRMGTTMEELEWMLSKAVGFGAGYGLVVDPKAVTDHGMMNELLDALNHWNRLLHDGMLSERQKSLLRDPYLDWHLEQSDSIHYWLHSQNVSRRFRCNLEELDEGVLRSETWTWSVEQGGRFGLRIQVDGDVEVINPMVNTTRGLVMFPCTIKPGQRLFYDFGDTARVVDASFHVVEEVAVEGLPELEVGNNEVYFICEVDPTVKQRPEVSLRYIIRESEMMVTLDSSPYK